MLNQRHLKATFLLLLHLLLPADVRAKELLDTQIGNAMNSEDAYIQYTLANIINVLEAVDRASTTTTTTPPTTTTVSTTTSTTTTTPKPPSFFTTESPLNFVLEKGNHGYSKDDMISFLENQLQEVSQWIDDDKKADRRSANHDPQLEGLLWGTAKAVWEVSRPVFLKTRTGRRISLLRDTVTLPLRTLNAFRNHIHDRRHHHHDHHPHHHHNTPHEVHGGTHGWGWGDDHKVYVKYEPENSLFKSWIRFLYRAAKPLALTKLRLKKALIYIKLRFLWKLVNVLKAAKLQKVFAALRALRTKLQLYRNRRRPHLVVLKEAWTTKAPPVHWGWTPPVAPATTPPPVGWTPPSSHWGSPSSLSSLWRIPSAPLLQWSTSSSHGSSPSSSNWNPQQLHSNPLPSHSHLSPSSLGPLIAPTPPKIYHSSSHKEPVPPSIWITAPGPKVKDQESWLQPQQVESLSASYAKHLVQQYVINQPKPNLSKLNSKPGPLLDLTRYLRESQKDSEGDEEHDVPYLMGNSTEEIEKRMLLSSNFMDQSD